MRRIRGGPGPARLPSVLLHLLPLRLVLLLIVVVVLTVGGIAKCELPEDGLNQVDTPTRTEKRIMDILNSVSVSHSIKRERNLLDGVINYIHYLKVLSLVAPRENVEAQGFINVDTSGKGAKGKGRLHIVYSPQANNYKNNFNDVRKEINKVLFT